MGLLVLYVWQVGGGAAWDAVDNVVDTIVVVQAVLSSHPAEFTPSLRAEIRGSPWQGDQIKLDGMVTLGWEDRRRGRQASLTVH